RTTGAALLADLAGYTALSTAFAAALGSQHGAEALAHTINRVYDALIAQVHAFGGSVLGFAGDSFLAWFADQGSGESPGVARRARWRARPAPASCPSTPKHWPPWNPPAPTPPPPRLMTAKIENPKSKIQNWQGWPSPPPPRPGWRSRLCPKRSCAPGCCPPSTT